MMKMFGIALGAGVTSAVLFAVTTTASPAALVLAYLAPLPIMIVGLGFDARGAGGAALVGAGALGVAMGPLAGVLFLVSLGLPAWYLARLATLPGSTPGGTTAADVAWVPIATLMPRLALLAAVPVLLAGIALVWRFGSYGAAVDTMAARLAALLRRDNPPGDVPFTQVVKLAPLAVAGSSTVMLAVNLWLAARTVQISGLLRRPWPDLPEALRLPRAAAAALVTFGVATLLPDPFGLAAAVLAAALGVVFVFEGLATAHVLTRGLTARAAALAAIYIATVFLMPWTLVALALLGCIDCLVPQLRRGAGIKATKLPTRKQ